MEIDRSRYNKVVLDTNALLSIEELKIDILEELRGLGYTEFIIPGTVLDEIEKLSGRGGRVSVASRVALKFAERMRIVDSPLENADESVIYTAKNEGAAVFTNDRDLRKKARSAGIPVVYIRNLKILNEKV